MNANTTTISGGKITTGSITADRMKVSDLSAISANIGTITSGHITGATIHAGSSEQVTIDSNGMYITAGGDDINKIRWSNGSAVFSGGTDYLMLYDSHYVGIHAGSTYYIFDNGNIYPESQADLGTQGNAWYDLYLNHSIHLHPETTTGAEYPLAIDGNNNIVQKTNGVNGSAGCSSVANMDVDRGIVTSVSCAAPQDTPAALRAEINDLRQQIAELRALLTAPLTQAARDSAPSRSLPR